jgi:hypothetical protein
MSLNEKLENVIDCDTFLEFVQALADDWENERAGTQKKKNLNAYDPVGDDSGWQNGTIGQYLAAASA